MNNNFKENKKIIFCFTGEPRSIIKGIKSRNKVFNQNSIYNFEVESRYIMSFLDSKYKSNNRSKILQRLGLLKYDKDVTSIKFNSHKYNNIWLNLIRQKYEILCDLKKEKNDLSEQIILLTRTDWFFTNSIMMLIQRSIENKTITVPFVSNEFYNFKGQKYKPIFDQFMTIPGDLISEVIKSLEISIEIALKQSNQINNKNLKLGGNGKHRYGITPENLLGLGFTLSKLNRKLEVIDNFPFSFQPDMYGTNKHNLIRDDAHIWMNLSLKDFLIKYHWFLKTKISKIFKKLFF